MNFLQKLFGNPVAQNKPSNSSPTWNINSLRKEIEANILEPGSLSWNRGSLRKLNVCGKGVYAVIDGNTIVSFNTHGKKIVKCYTHDQPIDSFAIDREGKIIAFTEKESRIIYLRTVENTGFNHQIKAENNVTSLTLSKRNLYAGTESAGIEKYSWDPYQPHKEPLKKYSFNFSKFFEEPPSVSFITLSPRNDRIAFIVGGILAVSKKGIETEYTMHLKNINRFMARFSNNNLYIAAAGGSFSASWSTQSGISISNAKGSIKVININDDNQFEYSGENCWIEDVVWSASSDKILCHLKVVTPDGSKVTKAISIHDVDAFISGQFKPVYIAKMPESVTLDYICATDEGGFLLEFEKTTDDDKPLWSVAEFFLHNDPVALLRFKSEQQKETYPYKEDVEPELIEADELPEDDDSLVNGKTETKSSDAVDSDITELVSKLGRRDLLGPQTHMHRLKELGQKAIPYLLPLLDDSDINVVADAAIILGQIGAKEAIPKLKELSRSKCFEIHKASLTALANLEKDENSLLRLDRNNPYSQISSLWTSIIQGREDLYPPEILHSYCEETIAEMPELAFSSKSEEARAWGMLGSLTFKSLHPEWPGGFNMTSPCSEARKCYEEALRCEPGDSWWSDWVKRFS